MNVIIDASHLLTSGLLLVFLCFIGEPDNPCAADQASNNVCGFKSHEITPFLLHSLQISAFSKILPRINTKNVFDLEDHI